jgi:hypothetical protein
VITASGNESRVGDSSRRLQKVMGVRQLILTESLWVIAMGVWFAVLQQGGF